VAVGNFRYTGGFRFKETAIKEYRGEYPPEYELRPGDILLVMTCQTAGGEILGIPAQIPDDGRTYLHNQRLGKVVVRAPEAVYPRFLYWLFLTREFNRELFASATGTKIVHTAPSRMEAFRFRLPSVTQQRYIAGVLDALDDKIELNRKMNETLEAMARALFKSWFVDFDPVRAKMAGRAPFGMDATTAGLFTFNQDVKALVPRYIVPSLLLLALLDAQAELLLKVESSGHGTGKLPSEILLAHPITMPPVDVQHRLSATFDTLLDRIALARQESRTLAELRDLLLPKLLSGELRIREAEKAVEAAL